MPRGIPNKPKAVVGVTVTPLPAVTPKKRPVPTDTPSERALGISKAEGLRCGCCECGTEASAERGEFGMAAGSDGIMVIFRCQPCAVKRLKEIYSAITENGRRFRAANEAK